MMDFVLSGSLLVVFSLFCYALCFFEQITPPPLIGHARQRRDLIGCGETRTARVQSVRALRTLPLETMRSELLFANPSLVQFMGCERTLRRTAVISPPLRHQSSRPGEQERDTNRPQT